MKHGLVYLQMPLKESFGALVQSDELYIKKDFLTVASLLSSWIARRGSAGSCLWYIYLAKTAMRLLPWPPCCVRACSSGDATSDGGFRRITLLVTEKASLTVWIKIWPGPSEKELGRATVEKTRLINNQLKTITKYLEEKTGSWARVHLLGCAAKTTSMVSTPTPMILTTAWPASVLARL